LAGVCTSPLGRARETAEAIARACRLEVWVEEAFVDMDFGGWQGLRLTEVEKRFPELYRTWSKTPAEARIPGAESLVEVKQRAVGAIAALAGRFPEDALCVVTHRVVSKLVMAWALGLDEAAFWRIRQDTACLNAFEYDGRAPASPTRAPVVHLLNDTCHLSAVAEGGKQADF
jgi:broad specificity phosphatase PhoE